MGFREPSHRRTEKVAARDRFLNRPSSLWVSIHPIEKQIDDFLDQSRAHVDCLQQALDNARHGVKKSVSHTVVWPAWRIVGHSQVYDFFAVNEIRPA